MARNKSTAVATDYVVTESDAPLSTQTAALNQLTAEASQLAALQQGYGQGRDLVNQLLGQAQAFQAAGNLLQTFGVSKLAIVKENKLYQQLSGSKTPNGLELKGTWVEFCELLGISDEKANQDIANLQAFGESALEQMQRAGIGYRDLRQFRKLPTDQRTALIEAAKEGDKDTLLELAEDLISKHTKEKEELTKRATEVEANYEKQGELIGGKDRKINELEMKLSKQRVSLTDWPEEFQGYINQVQHARRLIEQNIGALDIIRTDSMTHEAAPGEEAALEKAREALGLELATAISRAKEVIEAAQHVFDKTLGALIGE